MLQIFDNSQVTTTSCIITWTHEMIKNKRSHMMVLHDSLISQKCSQSTLMQFCESIVLSNNSYICHQLIYLIHKTEIFSNLIFCLFLWILSLSKLVFHLVKQLFCYLKASMYTQGTIGHSTTANSKGMSYCDKLICPYQVLGTTMYCYNFMRKKLCIFDFHLP